MNGMKWIERDFILFLKNILYILLFATLKRKEWNDFEEMLTLFIFFLSILIKVRETLIPLMK